MALLVRHLQRLYRNWLGRIKTPKFSVGCPVAYVQLYMPNAYVCVHVYICVNECVYVCVHACVSVCMRVVMHMFVWLCACVCVCVCVFDEYAHL